MKNILLALALTIPFISVSYAKEAPEQIVETYLKEVNTNGFTNLSSQFHPDELKKLKEAFVTFFEIAEDPAVIESFMGKKYSMKEVKKMSDSEFASKILKSVNALIDQDQIEFTRSEVIGSIAEKDNIHVLVRQYVKFEGGELSAKDIVTLKPYGGSYKVMFSDTLDAMVQGLKAGATD
jgi:hypothetical protein